MMFGFACDETPELMPMPIMYAHLLTRALSRARRSGAIPWLRPDGKSQVSVVYENGRPSYIDTVVVSTQHDPDVRYNIIRKTIIERIILKALPKRMFSKKTNFLINPPGRFVIGGPQGDTGLTGRKIIADTYGGMGRHGGGVFRQGPPKVDRTAAHGKICGKTSWPPASRAAA